MNATPAISRQKESAREGRSEPRDPAAIYTIGKEFLQDKSHWRSVPRIAVDESLNFSEPRGTILWSQPYCGLAATGWGMAMTASEIVTAYEAGIITENEATEQGLVDTLDDLYSRLANERRFGSAAAGRHTGMRGQH